MIGIVARRLLAAVPTLFLASIVVFLLVQIIPGDPAIVIAGESATDAQIAEIRNVLGLNDPVVVQYWHWLTNALQGDLGSSLFTREPVGPALLRTVPITLMVVGLAFLVAVVLGIAGGVIAAWKANSWLDRIITGAAAVAHSMPSFWLGLVLVIVFALTLQLVPPSGSVSPSEDFLGAVNYSLLPGAAMGVVGAAEIARQVRGAMITALASEASRAHVAKGLSSSQILRHAFRNSGIATLTICGLVFNHFLGATVVIEAVFGVGGLGGQIIIGTLQKDYPIIQGVVLVTATAVILVNIIVDLLYRVVDPRTR